MSLRHQNPIKVHPSLEQSQLVGSLVAGQQLRGLGFVPAVDGDSEGCTTVEARHKAGQHRNQRHGLKIAAILV